MKTDDNQKRDNESGRLQMRSLRYESNSFRIRANGLASLPWRGHISNTAVSSYECVALFFFPNFQDLIALYLMITSERLTVFDFWSALVVRRLKRAFNSFIPV